MLVLSPLIPVLRKVPGAGRRRELWLWGLHKGTEPGGGDKGREKGQTG